MLCAIYSSGVARRARYVAALRPPASVAIQQVEIPVGCGGICTYSQVSQGDNDGLNGAIETAAIYKIK